MNRKVKKPTETLLQNQIVYMYYDIYYADMNMMYVNCKLSNNKK